MAQVDRELLRHALEIEAQAEGFFARAQAEAADPLLAATFHFLQTQATLALHQLADEQARLEPPPEGAA